MIYYGLNLFFLLYSSFNASHKNNHSSLADEKTEQNNR